MGYHTNHFYWYRPLAGGGKSSVYQVVGKLKANITLVIESTLLLSADQYSYINHLSKDENVLCFQLDAAKKGRDIDIVYKCLTRLLDNSNTTKEAFSSSVFIFSSPEALI